MHFNLVIRAADDVYRPPAFGELVNESSRMTFDATSVRGVKVTGDEHSWDHTGKLPDGLLAEVATANAVSGQMSESLNSMVFSSE